MKNIITAVKGTRDFYPEDMAVRTWLYGVIRQVSESFGYQEYEAPFIESLELYAAKSGEELVKEQSFVFPDRGGDLITLRPELTPSLVRMVAQRQSRLTFPLRWWSFGPFWRYERPQKGRSREFFQWNIDLIGVGTAEGDAEIVATIAAFFHRVGLTPGEVAILVNNRRLMDDEIKALGIAAAQKSDVFRLIDRRDKMSAEAWEAQGGEIGLDARRIDGLKQLLADGSLWQKSEELVRFFAACQALGVQDYVRYDAGVIRGLDYYTGTVFEAQDQVGEVRRAILGGGRYDNLMADVGGAALPGVGYAMGDVVITLILKSLGRVPEDILRSPAPVMVTVFDEGHIPAAYALAAELRRAGLNVACYPVADKLAKQFKYADRVGARVAAVIGPDELAKDVVTLKNLLSRDQQLVARAEVVRTIRQMLAGMEGS